MFASIPGTSRPIFRVSFTQIATRSGILTLALLLAACAAKPPPRPLPPPAPPAAPIPNPPPRIEPPNFTGLSPEGLRARLGAPAFSRKDGATEMWRYDASACRALFFFTGNQVSHVETIPQGAGNAADPACLIALKKAP